MLFFLHKNRLFNSHNFRKRTKWWYSRLPNWVKNGETPTATVRPPSYIILIQSLSSLWILMTEYIAAIIIDVTRRKTYAMNSEYEPKTWTCAVQFSPSKFCESSSDSKSVPWTSSAVMCWRVWKECCFPTFSDFVRAIPASYLCLSGGIRWGHLSPFFQTRCQMKRSRFFSKSFG